MKIRLSILSIKLLILSACSAEHISPLDNSLTDSNGTATSRCVDQIKGSWSFGMTPYGCRMPSSATANADDNFRSFAVDPTKDKDQETQRYVEDMNDFLISTSEDYLERREPKVSQAELDAWVLLTLAITHQESYWTHYRIGDDNQIRLLRGDSYHGYGMMQIDDRWHKDFIRSGDVFDLKEHLIYALDLMYDLRKKIKKKPCSNAESLDALNRSIYSAYNGGINVKCRWKNPSHKWARNDKGFYKKYQERVWERYTLVQLPPDTSEVVTTEDLSREPSDAETNDLPETTDEENRTPELEIGEENEES